MGVTYEDIASRAEVSTATVSRVLSGAGYVRPELAKRVRDAAHELGYRHNQAARALRRNRSDTIGLVISDIEQPFFASIARAVEEEAAAQERPVLLCNTDEDLEQEKLYIELLIEERVAGRHHRAVDTRPGCARAFVPGRDTDGGGRPSHRRRPDLFGLGRQSCRRPRHCS